MLSPCGVQRPNASNAAVQGARRHSLNRHAVTTLRCNACNEVQPLAKSCRACGTLFGQYACLECRFFDHDTKKKQFHCPHCNICRVGGAANFFHCSECASFACCREHKANSGPQHAEPSPLLLPRLVQECCLRAVQETEQGLALLRTSACCALAGPVLALRIRAAVWPLHAVFMATVM